MSEPVAQRWLRTMLVDAFKDPTTGSSWRLACIAAWEVLGPGDTLTDDDLQFLRGMIGTEENSEVRLRLIEFFSKTWDNLIPDVTLVSDYCIALADELQQTGQWDSQRAAIALCGLHDDKSVPWKELKEHLVSAVGKERALEVFLHFCPLDWEASEVDSLGKFGKQFVELARLRTRREIFYDFLSLVFPGWIGNVGIYTGTTLNEHRTYFLERLIDQFWLGEFMSSPSACRGAYFIDHQILTAAENSIFVDFINRVRTLASQNENWWSTPEFKGLCTVPLQGLIGDGNVAEAILRLPEKDSSPE